MLGKCEEFKPESETWASYYERFNNWAFVNEITAKKISRVLLAVMDSTGMGSTGYELVKTLSNGSDPTMLSLKKEHTSSTTERKEACF
ncbi:hypothetical protein HZS_6987 [Henneguya salminicola]|nr:hypothetical protein HZS_6987 [Henneguya salminicola]